MAAPRALRALVLAVSLLLLAPVAAAAQDPKLPPSQTEAPPFFERTGVEAQAIAERADKVREARRDGPLSKTAYTRGTGRWQVSFFRDGDEVAQVLVDDRDRRDPRAVERRPGGVADGARLSGRLRAQAERAVRLAPAVRALPAAVRRLPPAAAAAPPRPAGAAGLRRLARLLQPRRDRRVGAARLSRAALPAGADPAGRAASARAARAARALRADGLAGGAADRPAGLPRRPERDRLERDRRRLRGGDRRGPDRRRRRALRRRLLRGRREGRHLRARELPALRALRAGDALERSLGRPAGRARGGDPVRPAHRRRAAPGRARAAAGAGGHGARGGARLRLGRLPVHDVLARDELQRHAGGARVRLRAAGLRAPIGRGGGRRDRARRGRQVRPARTGAAVRAAAAARVRCASWPSCSR